MATSLFQSLKPSTNYFDKKLEKEGITKEIYGKKLEISTTVYVGNLSIYTTEESIYELFSRCGEINQIQIGINKSKGTPIGFCFVEFFTHDNAAYAVECLSQTKLDNRVIRVDWDVGFEDGRQFGRGKGGIQVRDAFRKDQDPERPEKQLNQNQNQNYSNNNRRGGYQNQNYKKIYNNNYNNNDAINKQNNNNNYNNYNNKNNQNYKNKNNWNLSQGQKGYKNYYNNNNKYDNQNDNYRRKKEKND